MVHPLVRDDKRPFDLSQMGDGVLCQDREAVGGDQFRNTVVDLRVHMVGTACKDDAVTVVFFHPLQCLLALFLHVQTGGQKLLPRLVGGRFHFLSGDLEILKEDLGQPLCQDLLVGKRHKRIEETDIFRPQLFHIVFDVFGVRGDDGAVKMVAGVRRLVALVRNAGIEDGLNALLDQPLDVAVSDLGRVAFRFTGDGFDSQLVYLPGGLRGKYRAELQLL